jgi:tape measure domain-containing protein
MAIRLEFKSNSRQARQDLSQLDRSVKNIDQNVAKASKGMSALASAAKIAGTAFAGIFATKQLAGVVDSVTLIENRIALVTGRTKELNKTFLELQQISLRSRGSLEGIADLYNRLGRTTKDLGVTNQEILKVTETIQKAITISGASAQSADAAIVQLGQGLAAGALRGQELNSVMEQTPRVASAIAAELGVGVGQLRKLAEQGKITSEVVVKAFKSQEGIINEEYAAVNATVGQSFIQVAQSGKLVIAEFVKGTGASDALANKLLDVAAGLTAIAPKAKGAGESFTKFFQTDWIDKLVEGITELGGGALESAFSGIEKFTTGVERAFFWVYDQVVGNSWWPDLVDEVNSYTTNLFESLYIVQDFTALVSDAFKVALITVDEFANRFTEAAGGLGEGFAITVVATQATGSAAKGIVSAFGLGFIDVISDALSYLETEFPYVFGAASGQITAVLVKILTEGFVPYLVVTLGNALAAGLSGFAVVKAVNNFTDTIATGLGRALGAILNPANLIALVAGFAYILVDAATTFGDAMLDALGPIGDILQFFTLGFAGDLLGAMVAVFAGKKLLTFFFGDLGAAVANAANKLFGGLAGQVTGQFIDVSGGLSQVEVLQQAALTAASKIKIAFLDLGGVLKRKMIPAGLSKNFEAMRLSLSPLKATFGELGVAILGYSKGTKKLSDVTGAASKVSAAFVTSTIKLKDGTKQAAKAVLTLNKASLKELLTMKEGSKIASLLATLKIGLAAATGILTTALNIGAVAARAFWIAVGGPIGRIVAALAFAITGLFAFASMFTDTAEEVDSGATILRNSLLDLVGLRANVGIEINVDTKTAEEGLDRIAEYNKQTLYDIRNTGENSTFWFEWMDDVVTYFSIKATQITGFFNRLFIDIKNGFGLLSSAITGEEFIPEEKDMRTAVEKMLARFEAIDFDLFIEIGTEQEIKDFVNIDDLDSLNDLQATALAVKEELSSAQLLTIINPSAVQDVLLLEARLQNLRNQIQQTARDLQLDISFGKGLKELNTELVNINKPAIELQEIFGESIVSATTLKDVVSLTGDQFERFTEASAQVEVITKKMREIIATSATLGPLDSERRDALAAQFLALQGQLVLIDQIKDGLETVTALEGAELINFGGTDVLKLNNEQLAKAMQFQRNINTLIASEARLRAVKQDDAADLVALEIQAITKQAETFGRDVSRSLMTTLDKTFAAFGDANIGVTRDEYSRLSNATKASLLDVSSTLSQARLEIEELRNAVNPNKNLIDQREQEYAAAAGQAARDAAKVVRYELATNLEKALMPFKDIGVAFSNEDFAKIGMTASAKILDRAKVLNAKLEALNARSFADTEEGNKQRLAAVADFNRQVMDLEEEAARARADAIKNETDATNFAKGFADVVTQALQGDVGLVDGFVSLLLTSMNNSLNDQIAAFAEGFIETLLGGIDSAEGAGGKAASVVKDILFGPSEGEKEDLSSKGSGIADLLLGNDKKNEHAGGVDLEGLGISGLAGGSNEKGGTAGAVGGFGSIVESVKNLGSTLLTEGFGGLGDLFGGLMSSLTQGLGSLFGGGGGAGGMLSTVMGFFGGMSDNGGSIASNKFNLVGERGPELISGPAKVYSRAKTAREMERSGGGGGNVTFALEGDFDSRAERAIRSMVQSGMLQSSLNGAEIENGGAQPVFRTP